MISTVDSDTVLVLPAAGLWLWPFLDSLSSRVSPIPILTAGPGTDAASYLCQRIRMYPDTLGMGENCSQCREILGVAHFQSG